MRSDLDDLLGGLARAPADHSLEALEPAVMAGVARERAVRRTLHALARTQALLVGVAVAIGLAAGGFAGLGAAQPQEVAMLSTELAPSTLLAANP